MTLKNRVDRLPNRIAPFGRERFDQVGDFSRVQALDLVQRRLVIALKPLKQCGVIVLSAAGSCWFHWLASLGRYSRGITRVIRDQKNWRMPERIADVRQPTVSASGSNDLAVVQARRCFARDGDIK